MSPQAQATHFILYTADQEASTRFYSQVLGFLPRLHVPGMTEFDLPGGGILGLMPETGIKRLLGDALPDPAAASGTPRAELYMVVDGAAAFHRRALSAGGMELSPVKSRDWGQDAGYSLDLDGHVLAFAQQQSRRHQLDHEVNVISVLRDSVRGVLLSATGSGRWGFVGSEDLRPGESWEETQARGMARDIGQLEYRNRSILHLESYAEGVVGPKAKFGVFVLCETAAGETDTGHTLPDGDGLAWVKSPAEAEHLDLIHPRVNDLLVRALKDR